jgi:hypothetical protein
MPHSKALESLHKAIAEENATATVSDAAYAQLLQSIVDFQNEVGEGPSMEEFSAWLEATRRRVYLKRLGTFD